VNLEKLYRALPFLSWLKELKNPKVLKADIIAWVTVAFVVVPQSMAYAQLAGLPVQVWLYTAFLPVIIAGLFGSSRQMSTGPVTIVSLMTAATLWPLAISSPEWYAAYASLLAFFIGLFYLLLWNLRLGTIVEFLSHPVILGFTNAVALITIIKQLPKIFGISLEKGMSYSETVQNLFITVFAGWYNNVTVLFWFGSIFGLIILKVLLPKLPRVLIVLVAAIILSYFFWQGDYGLKIVWEIPKGLPSFDVMFFNQELEKGLKNFEIMRSLFFSALIIGLLGFTESISVAKFVWATTRQRVAPNRELFGQWMANLASSFFGWYWVAWSFSKTAVNLKAWAVTWFASVVTGWVVWIVLLFFTWFLESLPMATLAAIIIVSVSSLIKFGPIIHAWKFQKQDGIVGLATFITTLFWPNLEVWILTWVLLSLLFFIYRTMKLRVVEVAKYKDWVLRDVELFGLKSSKDISIIRIEWNLYFANSWATQSKILELISEKKKLKYVILDLAFLTDMDSSWLYSFENLIFSLDKIGVKVYIVGLKPHIIEKLDKVKFIKDFKKKNIFTKIKRALEKIEKREDWKVDIESFKDYKPYKKLDDEGKEILKKYGG
jgi:sulfate permease, SulP family